MRSYNAGISWQEALRTPGAFILRYPPGSGQMGHIGICVGDGDAIYEAHSTNRGVIRGSAANRRWDSGVILPGVSYAAGAVELPANFVVYQLTDPPGGYDPVVEYLQTALKKKGFLAAHDISGVYYTATSEAVAKFQDLQGLLVDGEIGPETGSTLLGTKQWNPVTAQSNIAQAPSNTTPATEDLLTLARTLYGELRGEPTEGQEAVANVIMNRVRSGRYPNSIVKVCLQPFQFSCWNKNDPNYPKIKGLKPGANAKFDECYAVAERVISGLVPDATSGALHYYAKYIAAPSWVTKSPKARMTAEIGVHRFYVGIN